MDIGEIFERAQDMLGRLEHNLLEHARRMAGVQSRNERQEFLDRSMLARALVETDVGKAAYWAERLWEERERQKGLPSEQELVVRWLSFQGRHAPEVKAATLFAAADAIKAGHHRLADPRIPAGSVPGLEPEVAARLEDSGISGGARTDEEMRAATIIKAYKELGYVAPELWRPSDAVTVRRYHQCTGEPIAPHVLAHIEKIEARALESEARRLAEQERRGG